MTDQENQNHSVNTDPEAVVESVRALIEMMNAGGIGELDLAAGDVTISLRTETVALAANTPAMNFAAPTGFAPYPMHAPEAVAPMAAIADVAAAPAQPDGHVVTSPMIGTFYSASAPAEPAFVQVGDEIETGQVIGIIEAMKIMNEITADRSGVVIEILVDNAEAVEYGSPLVRISDSARLD